MRKQIVATVFGISLAASTLPVSALPVSTTSADAIPPASRADFRSSEIPAAVRDAWDATVFISTRSWAGTSGFPDYETGSGLVIALDDHQDVWIATSAHVVPCTGRCLVRVHLPRVGAADRSVSTSAKIVWRDAAQDLALLRCTLPRRGQVTVARHANGPLADGTTVVAVGFPDLRLLGEKERSGATPAKRFSFGRVLSKVTGLQADYFTFGSRHAAGRLAIDHALTHDAALLPGSSGGPLVDDRGRVLGINTGSLTQLGSASCADHREHCNVHLAVPIGEILERARSSKH